MMVNNRCTWYVIGCPTTFLQSQTEIDIFAIEWETLIEELGPFDRPSAYQYARIKHPIHAHLMFMRVGNH